MFSKNEILAQLRDGADASDIAQKMADELNAAIQEYEKQQANAKRLSARRSAARDMVDVMSKFFSTYVDQEEFSEEDLEQATDAVLELIDSVDELKSHLDKSFLNVSAPKTERSPIGHSASSEDEIDDTTLLRFLSTLK